MNPFLGTWIFRSFIDSPDLAVNFDALRFGLGVMTIAETADGGLTGLLKGEHCGLKLSGQFTLEDNPQGLSFRAQTDIQGEPWVYDCRGFLLPLWPDGVDQRISLSGKMIRVFSHSNGDAPAGAVATWIAVYHSENPGD